MNGGFLVADNGNAKFAEDGIAGMAYQGAENAYILVQDSFYIGK